MRRRTYRAHGRINGIILTIFFGVFSLHLFFIYSVAYMSCPAHIEIIAEQVSQEVQKEKEVVPVKVSKKRQAQLRAIKAGGGVA